MTSLSNISQLKPDKRNARKHNDRNIGMIADSLREVGAARSIVIDEDTRKWGRWQHQVDYSPFKRNRLKLNEVPDAKTGD